jgi:alkylhydroperoxidase family enzyme
MSVRRAVARPIEAGDLMEEAVRYEHSTVLTEQQKVALRLHGAFLSNPAGLGHEARADVLAHFTAAQIVELAFKFIWWSTNRATVTLGDDAPHDSERLAAFHYDKDGSYIVHTAGD